MRRVAIALAGLFLATTGLVGLKSTVLGSGPPYSAVAHPSVHDGQTTLVGDPVATVWKGHNYGQMQVSIVVTGRHIDIVTLRQSNRPRTVSTELRLRALTAQSANVGIVSGATASSLAYRQSLTSAIGRIP